MQLRFHGYYLKGNYLFTEAFQNFLLQPNTSNPTIPFHFINTDLYYLQICSTVITMSKIYTGRFGVQILAPATELSLFQIIHTNSSTHPASNSMKNQSFFSDSKVARADSLTTHICLEQS
jgi:hypothetical protein